MEYAMELHKSMDNIIIQYTCPIYNAQDDIHQKGKRARGRALSDFLSRVGHQNWSGTVPLLTLFSLSNKL